MVAKALFVLGPVALVLGAVESSIALVLIGALWLAIAFPATWHSRTIRTLLASHREEPNPTGPPAPISTVLGGAALYLLAGVPALVVGITTWGVDDSDVRWVPLVVGALLTGLAVLSTGLYLLGSGLNAVAGEAPTVPARVVIVSTRPTGTYINEQPRIEFQLDVTPEGMATYRVTKKATVPPTALGAIQPGHGFEALVVGPDDPTQMTIDWSSPLAPAQTAGSAESVADRLRRLDDLRAQGLVTDDEHAAERRRILGEL